MQLLPSSRPLIAALLLGSALLFTAAVVYAHGGGGHGGGHGSGHGSSSHGTSNCGKSTAHPVGGFGANTFDHFGPTPNAVEHAAPGADAAPHAQDTLPNPSSAGDESAQQRYDQRSGDGD
jgi:hypothetical protein